MVKSILDTDLYKFSVSYAYFNLYPLAEGTFTFKDRNNEQWKGKDVEQISYLFGSELENATQLSLSNKEMEWCIRNIPYIPRTYWEWLSTFRFDIDKMKWQIDANGVFQCKVTDNLYKVTLYEIMVLAVYSEVRNKMLRIEPNIEKTREIIYDKVHFANTYNIPFSEFGTRRRFSSNVHEAVLDVISNFSETCVGTSNVMYAMEYGMKPNGTFPHEWVMFHAGCFGYKRANYLSLEDWITTYRGDLGTALVDTYTTDSFLRTLTKQQALLLTGFRQDSGDERLVGNKIIKRLEELGIDPLTKTIIFSNALDFHKAFDVMEYFKGRCKIGFGIGTNLTCDVGIENYKPANIVMKLSDCRLSSKDPFENCIKISDDKGKHMGDSDEFEIAFKELKLEK